MIINNINTISFTGKFKIAKKEVAKLTSSEVLSLQRQREDLEDEFLDGDNAIREDKKYYYLDIKDKKDRKFQIMLECFHLNYGYKNNPRRY